MAFYNAAVDLIDRNLPQRRDHAAFIDERGPMSYGALAGGVDQAAGALRALGLDPESRIGLVMLDTNEFPLAFLGAIKAGIVPIPLNTLFPASDHAFILSDSRAKAVVVSVELLPKVLEAAAIAGWAGEIIVSDPAGDGDARGYRRFADLVAAATPLTEAFPTRPDDPCFWLYSSGSTGRPKGAVHVQTSMAQTADLFAREILGFNAGDVVFSAAKLFFAYGLGNALSFPLAAGATSVLFAGRVTPDLVCDVLTRYRPTIFCAVPTLFSALLLHSGLPKAGNHSMRLCTSAGEVLPEAIGNAWTAHTGVEIIDGIGSTEMLHIFVSNRPGDVRYGTTGKPVPGYRARVMDEHGASVQAGEIGELEIAGPTAATHYWNNLEKSRRTFVGEWTRTGDKFYVDDDGYYHHCGRADDMLKVGGIWVSPSEVESALTSHDDVLECAVIGVADEHELIKPKAFVVLKPGVAGDENVLKAHVKSQLAPYKYPRWIEFVAELPKTPTGKIQRHVLREREALPLRSDVIVAGRDLEVAWFGSDKASAPIVMLHEGLGSVSHWRDFPELLAARSARRVVAYSRYGYGQSDVLEGPRAADYMHDEAEVVLPALLAALGIERPVLFGHSDGASIALIFAARYPLACAALVLEAPHVFVEAETVASIARIGDVARKTDLLAKMAPHHRDPARTFWGWNDIWLAPEFRKWDITDRLTSVTAPVLVFQGRDDEYGTTAQVDALAARVPQLEARFIDNCGHSPHRSAPAIVLDATAQFLKDVRFAGPAKPRE